MDRVITGYKPPSPELFPETKGSVRTQFTGQPYKPCIGNSKDAQKQNELFWKAVPEPNNDITGQAMAFSASLSLAAKTSVLKLVSVGTLWRLKACSGRITERCCGSCCTHRTSKGYWWNTAFTDIKSKFSLTSIGLWLFNLWLLDTSGYVPLCVPCLEKSHVISQERAKRYYNFFLELTGTAFCVCYSLPLMLTSLLNPLFLG